MNILVLENHILKSIINYMIYETDEKTVNDIMIKSNNILFIIGNCMQNGYSMKEIMNLLTNEEIDFDKRIYMLKCICTKQEDQLVKTKRLSI